MSSLSEKIRGINLQQRATMGPRPIKPVEEAPEEEKPAEANDNTNMRDDIKLLQKEVATLKKEVAKLKKAIKPKK